MPIKVFRFKDFLDKLLTIVFDGKVCQQKFRKLGNKMLFSCQNRQTYWNFKFDIQAC